MIIFRSVKKERKEIVQYSDYRWGIDRECRHMWGILAITLNYLAGSKGRFLSQHEYYLPPWLRVWGDRVTGVGKPAACMCNCEWYSALPVIMRAANLPNRVGQADILHRLGTFCISRQAYQQTVSNISKIIQLFCCRTYSIWFIKIIVGTGRQNGRHRKINKTLIVFLPKFWFGWKETNMREYA